MRLQWGKEGSVGVLGVCSTTHHLSKFGGLRRRTREGSCVLDHDYEPDDGEVEQDEEEDREVVERCENGRGT